jgi:hypothetical protein
MHSVHCGSAVFPFQALERRPAQETLEGCTGLKNKNSVSVDRRDTGQHKRILSSHFDKRAPHRKKVSLTVVDLYGIGLCVICYVFLCVLCTMCTKWTHIGLKILSVRMIQLNRWTDLDEILYGRCTIEFYLKIVLFSFLQSVRRTWRTDELMMWDRH